MMNLKGVWSAETEYTPGDVVEFSQNSGVYCLREACPVGTQPIDTMYWNEVNGILADSVRLTLDAVAMANTAAQAALENYFLNDQTLILKAGEGDDEKAYAITVDASGDTPELDVAEVEEEESES